MTDPRSSAWEQLIIEFEAFNGCVDEWPVVRIKSERERSLFGWKEQGLNQNERQNSFKDKSSSNLQQTDTFFATPPVDVTIPN